LDGRGERVNTRAREGPNALTASRSVSGAGELKMSLEKRVRATEREEGHNRKGGVVAAFRVLKRETENAGKGEDRGGGRSIH